MEQTLLVGDRVLVNKVAVPLPRPAPRRDRRLQRPRQLRRGRDLRQARQPGRPRALRALSGAIGLGTPDEKDYIKRVIGIPGDRVMCCDTSGRVVVTSKGGAASRWTSRTSSRTTPATPGTSATPARASAVPAGCDRCARAVGAAVGDGRPPGQLVRLALPPQRRAPGDGPRGQGRRPCVRHRLPVRPRGDPARARRPSTASRCPRSPGSAASRARCPWSCSVAGGSASVGPTGRAGRCPWAARRGSRPVVDCRPAEQQALLEAPRGGQDERHGVRPVLAVARFGVKSLAIAVAEPRADVSSHAV